MDTHFVQRLLLAAVPLALAACGTPSGAGPQVQVITVRATEFAFSENPIRVPAGRPVRLVVANNGAVEHDLVVQKLPAQAVRAAGGHGHASEVAAHAAAGKQAWVEFTATAKGTYDAECTVPGHKEAGMRTTVIVE
jgi:uncharacterized cupredoxin-like copper-binding protein